MLVCAHLTKALSVYSGKCLFVKAQRRPCMNVGKNSSPITHAKQCEKQESGKVRCNGEVHQR